MISALVKAVKQFFESAKFKLFYSFGASIFKVIQIDSKINNPNKNIRQ